MLYITTKQVIVVVRCVYWKCSNLTNPLLKSFKVPSKCYCSRVLDSSATLSGTTGTGWNCLLCLSLCKSTLSLAYVAMVKKKKPMLSCKLVTLPARLCLFDSLFCSTSSLSYFLQPLPFLTTVLISYVVMLGVLKRGTGLLSRC